MRIPKIRSISLDFSQFHPLDHRIGSKYCRHVTNFPDAPQGWSNIRIHARYWWDFKAESTWWYAGFFTYTHCIFGRHKPRRWMYGNPVAHTDVRCGWCDKVMEAKRPISPEEDDQGEVRDAVEHLGFLKRARDNYDPSYPDD